MSHPLIEQLRFTRSEWRRGLAGLSEEAATHHLGRMNSIGWIIGHLAWQEQSYLLYRPHGILLDSEIQRLFAYRAPMSTPALRRTLTAWRSITAATESYLDRLKSDDLWKDLPRNGRTTGQSQGSAIQRMTYHYWFHIGEIQAIRRVLQHQHLPIYVGDIEGRAPYRTEE